MNSALHVGRTALLSYQSALETIGSNISSAASPDYTRLTPELDPLQGPVQSSGLQPGAGVALTGIQRNIDEALENRIRTAIGSLQNGDAQQLTLAEIESFLDDTTGAGVDSRLRAFFSAFDSLQNTPEDTATRDLALTAASQLAESLRSLRARFSTLGAAIDGQIGDIVATADNIARKIGKLNEEITTAEAGRRGQATGLRDQRDALLRELSEFFDLTVREQPNGALNVYIGSEALIQSNFVRGLVAVQELDGEFSRTTVQFADTAGQVDVRGGQLQGMITARDQHAYGQVTVVDELASAMIREANRIHADGQGIVGFESVTASYDALATDLPLDSSAVGLPATPQSGSFFITVADDATGTPVAYRIEIDFDEPGSETTLESLVTDINEQLTGVTASITTGNRLTLQADDGFSFSFGHDGQVAREDTSGVLAALGINTLFTGTDARNIEVNSDLRAQPRLLAAASTFHAGDGVNAGLMASLETTAVDFLRGATIRDAYNAFIGSVAIASSSARDNAEAARSILESLRAQKESISGVNLDEEAISLLKFERAFQGVARYISVVDQLIRELITLIR